ncbi:glucosaminidase domain-containing protein [Phaeodactylibacter luteus]|uniref:Uncharacterized protein n=1 Tax=Phaeodactylibacter luteus TaxID=1564516 RepID=A0A5C6RK96_9BACT|nr:glucosaminidase domain-containing protein [Phaeodactylibacter luteus]TXB61782.1 hypothetical protein FRY97_17280 [Phaeodactylibacter luteus]
MKCSCFTLLLAVLCLALPLRAQLPDGQVHDTVQDVLARLSATAPQLVGWLPETSRFYLVTPRSSVLTDYWLKALQDAFFREHNELCRRYSYRYLCDWRALMAKAARESFWGTSYLCNRTFNYFGIRHAGKPWLCESLGYCRGFWRNDPEPAYFAVFPGFRESLWAFVHTIYSSHFLARLPDGGLRVLGAIQHEREHGLPYWSYTADGLPYAGQLDGVYYSLQSLIDSWSGHEINNLCLDCDRETDWHWVRQVEKVALRL